MARPEISDSILNQTLATSEAEHQARASSETHQDSLGVVVQHVKGGLGATLRTLDEAAADRILQHHEHDRDGRGRPLKRSRPDDALGQDDIGILREDLVRLPTQRLGVAVPVAEIDREVLAGRKPA